MPSKVDFRTCELQNRPSQVAFDINFGRRHYSYAACRYPDTFHRDITHLNDQVLKVAFLNNDGGWKGVYSDSAEDFTPSDTWRGPTVDFLRTAAQMSGVKSQVMAPPAMLTKAAKQFYRREINNMDLCVYATTLGFLDICVALMLIDNSRASTTDWIIISTFELYLVVKNDDPKSIVEQLKRNTELIFRPYKATTWLFMALFVIPVFGMLLLYHEYGQSYSIFPEVRSVMVHDKMDSNCSTRIDEEMVPMHEHIVSATHKAFLASNEATYGSPIYSTGGHLTLLGFTFFILLNYSVYTANLTAMLTYELNKTPIRSLDDAINKRMRLCAQRRVIQWIQRQYKVNLNSFAIEPTDEGGDGGHGFTSPHLDPRKRVFDFLDPKKAKSGDKRYCEAAIVIADDLDVLHSQQSHCNKTVVGGAVSRFEVGIPVYEGRSAMILPMLLKLKNNGVYDRLYIASRPYPACPVSHSSQTYGDTASIGIGRLMGLWIFLAVTAASSMIVRYVLRRRRQHKEHWSEPLKAVNQHGEVIHLIEDPEIPIAGKYYTDHRSGRKFLHGSQAPKASISDQILVDARKLFERGFRLKSLRDLEHRTMEAEREHEVQESLSAHTLYGGVIDREERNEEDERKNELRGSNKTILTSLSEPLSLVEPEGIKNGAGQRRGLSLRQLVCDDGMPALQLNIAPSSQNGKKRRKKTRRRRQQQRESHQ